MARTTSTKRAQRGKARWEKKATTKLLSRKPKPLDERERHSRPRLLNGVSERAPRGAAVTEIPSAPKLPRIELDAPVADLPPPSAVLDFELTFEHEFFSWNPPPLAPLPDFVEDGETVEELLTLAEHQRRMRFRRRVTQLILALAAFTVLALILRLAAQAG